MPIFVVGISPIKVKGFLFGGAFVWDPFMSAVLYLNEVCVSEFVMKTAVI